MSGATGRGDAGPAATTGWRTAARGIKARLALVVALALLPPTAYALVQAARAAGADERQEVAMLRQTLELVADGHLAQMAQSRQLLATLAGQPQVGSADLAACDAALAAEVAQGPAYRAFVRTDTAGVVVCASHPRLLDLELADRSWFRMVVDGEARLVLSETLTSKDPEIGRTVVIATSLRDAAGTVLGTLAAALSLDDLLVVPNDAGVPDGIAAALVDRAGAIALQVGSSAQPLLSPADLTALQAAPDQPLLAAGPDGQTWRFMGTSPAGAASFSLVVAGLPATPWSWLDLRFQSAVVVPALLLLLSVIAVWVATDAIVTRPVLTLAARVRQYRRSGELIPSGLDGAPSELDELAQAYADLTLRVREREEALRGTVAEKDELLREIHHRVKNNLQIVASLLNLRAAAASDPAARRALGEARLRVEALSLVNRGVQPQRRVVALDALLDELAHLVHELDPAVADRVRLEVGTEPLMVSADQATPIMLLATELLSIVTGHADLRGRSSRLSLRLTRKPGPEATLEIADDGGGIAGITQDGAAGLTLVTMLAKQAGGVLAVDSGPAGVRVSFRFVPQDGVEIGEMSSTGETSP